MLADDKRRRAEEKKQKDEEAQKKSPQPANSKAGKFQNNLGAKKVVPTYRDRQARG